MKTLLRVADKRKARRASRGTDPPRPRSAKNASKRKAAAPALDAPSPAALRRSAQFPAFAPLMEELEVAGWSSHRRSIGGSFHDWLLLGDGRLLVTAGQTAGSEPWDPHEKALVAQSAWTAVRAHALHARDAGTLLSLAARTLWPVPTASVHTSVAVALVDPVGGRASVAVAGGTLVWRIRAAMTEELAGDQPPLGAATDVAYRTHRFELALRERLLIIADDPARRHARDATSIAARFSTLDAENHRRMTAADAAGLVREHFEHGIENDHAAAVSVAAVRRR